MRKNKTGLLSPQALALRSDERIRLEHQLAGSVIAFSVGRKPYLAGDVLAVCSPEAFLSPKAKAVMYAVRAVLSRGERVDLVTVGLEIKAQGDSGTIPSWDFVDFVYQADSFVTESSVLTAARQVADEWRKDKAAVELDRALGCLRVFGDPLEIALHCLREAGGILDGGEDGREVGFDDRLDEYECGLDAPERALFPVRAPWDSVTRILRGGILPTELAVLAARPSVGKTAFALNWAWSVAASGAKAMVFSLEMGRQQLIDRLVANTGGVDLGSFRMRLSGRQKEQAKEALRRMRGKLLDIVDDTRLTVGEIRRRIRLAQRRGGKVGLVVVDYLQLLTPDDKRIPREQQVAEMSRALKETAKELRVPMLLLAQLNRKVEENKRTPVLSDLRESGSIEQDADIVIFLHQARAAWHHDEPVQCIVAKGRSSGVGRESLIFRRRYQRFEESDAETFRQAEEQEYAERHHWSETEQEALC